jgi:hypothetical protein
MRIRTYEIEYLTTILAPSVVKSKSLLEMETDTNIEEKETLAVSKEMKSQLDLIQQFLAKNAP